MKKVTVYCSHMPSVSEATMLSSCLDPAGYLAIKPLTVNQQNTVQEFTCCSIICLFNIIVCNLTVQFTHPKHLHTCWRETKLPAGHISISGIPGVITHSAPLEVTAYLDSTFKGIRPILQSDVTVCTQSCGRIGPT